MADESNNVQFMLGNIVARLNAQDVRHDEMKTALAGQDSKLDTILAHVERQRGGRKMLVMLGSGLAATVSAAVSFGTAWLTSKPD